MSFTHKGAGEPHQHEHVWQARVCTSAKVSAADARLGIARAAQRAVDSCPTQEGKVELLIARYGGSVVKASGTEAYDGEDSLGGLAEDVFWKRVYAAQEAEQERRAYAAEMARDARMGF
jgi:hypothetical protein